MSKAVHKRFFEKSPPEDILLQEKERMVAALRNFPNNDSIAKNRPVRTLADCIPNILSRFRVSERTPQEILLEHWEEIFGNPGTAQLCQPQRIDASWVLWIAVSDPIIRQELTFHRKRMLNHIQRLSGCGVIRDLRFCQG